MNERQEVSIIVAGMLGGGGAAAYLEMDGLTSGYKIAMTRLVNDAKKIHEMIDRKCFAVEVQAEPEAEG